MYFLLNLFGFECLQIIIHISLRLGECCMKIRIKILGIIALIITLVMGCVNWIMGKTIQKIIGITFWGGDVSFSYGFGVLLEIGWPLYSLDNPIDCEVMLKIAPINFVLTVMGIWILSYLVCWIYRKMYKK